MRLLEAYRFWEWFTNNYERYERLAELEEMELRQVLEEADQWLTKYCSGLHTEFNIDDPEERKMIITAGAHEQYFTRAEDLVMMAPKLKGWRFIALQPPAKDYPIALEYEGLQLRSDNLWFLPYDAPDEPHRLGVMVLFKDYDPAKEDVYFRAANKMLFLLLGEKSGILDVPCMQVDKMEDGDDETMGILELEMLPEYIEMRKGQAALN